MRQRAILIVVMLMLVLGINVAAHAAETPSTNTVQATYQGKTAHWWAMRAQQARRDANTRAVTIRRLKKTLHTDTSITSAVALASVVYPQLSIDRAWCLIGRESNGSPNARNRQAIWNGEHATGLYQFIPSTFNSTPFGRFSIYDPLAQALAAGWMHAHGRGGEWSTCRR